MRSKRHISKGKRINPHFWVFCEGETEEAYIRLLRSEYRLPVEIIPKIAGSRIDSRFINSFKKGTPQHEKDKDFLIYDADVSEILERLKRVPEVVLIISNPTIELWFLLHYKTQTTYITEDECIKQLSNRNKNRYRKGFIDEMLKCKLLDKTKEACCRSKSLILFENPSSNIHIFIEALDKVKASNLNK